MSVTSASSEARSEVQGRLSTIAVAFLVFAAAIAGLVLGGVYASKPAPRGKPPATTIAAAGVRLELPSGWARGGSAAVSGFDHPLWLHNTRAHVSAAVELRPAASPTLLPLGLKPSGGPATVQLGPGRMAWRYRLLPTAGVPLVLYVAPTTKGIATVGCLDVSGGVAEQACKAIAVALTVPGTRRLETGQRAAFFSRLPATVAGLDAARAKGVRALAAATRPAGQALAADGLARAHRAAATDLAPVSSAGDGLAHETLGALGATASAYTALANAARARSPQPYAEARTAVSGADGQLRRAMTKMAAAVETASDRAATKSAVSPASTPAATDSKQPAAVSPASTPAATDSKQPASKPASREPAKVATMPKESSGGFNLALPLLLLVVLLCAGVAGFFDVRRVLRQSRA